MQLKPVCCFGGPCLLNVVVALGSKVMRDVNNIWPLHFPLSTEFSGKYKRIAHHDWRAIISVLGKSWKAS
jgi:hypothetical protein